MAVSNSVLITTKKLLGIDADCKDFDTDLIIHINAVLMILAQMNIVEPGSMIDNEKTSWDDIVNNIEEIEGIKSYMYLKVKTLFDPPTNSGALEALNNMVREMEWRMYSFRDPIGMKTIN